MVGNLPSPELDEASIQFATRLPRQPMVRGKDGHLVPVYSLDTKNLLKMSSRELESWLKNLPEGVVLALAGAAAPNSPLANALGVACANNPQLREQLVAQGVRVSGGASASPASGYSSGGASDSRGYASGDYTASGASIGSFSFSNLGTSITSTFSSWSSSAAAWLSNTASMALSSATNWMNKTAADFKKAPVTTTLRVVGDSARWVYRQVVPEPIRAAVRNYVINPAYGLLKQAYHYFVPSPSAAVVPPISVRQRPQIPAQASAPPRKNLSITASFVSSTPPKTQEDSRGAVEDRHSRNELRLANAVIPSHHTGTAASTASHPAIARHIKAPRHGLDG